MNQSAGNLELGRFEYCLNVKDIEASLDFYQKLGFTQTGGEMGEGWLVLTSGACILGLFEGHLKQNVMNFRGGDVFKLTAELKARGLKITEGPLTEEDGSAGAILHDPDGNEIYLNTAPGEEI